MKLAFIAFIAEEEPRTFADPFQPHPRCRGYCEPRDGYQGPEDGPGWDDPHEALAWALERAETAIIRIGSDTHFYAGRRDPDWGSEIAAWPPSRTALDAFEERYRVLLELAQTS